MNTNIDIGAIRIGYREARAYRRRQRAKRIVKLIVLGLLTGLALVVLWVLVALAARPASGQGLPHCYISAPTLPQSDIDCLQPRVFAPVVAKTP